MLKKCQNNKNNKNLIKNALKMLHLTAEWDYLSIVKDFLYNYTLKNLTTQQKYLVRTETKKNCTKYLQILISHNELLLQLIIDKDGIHFWGFSFYPLSLTESKPFCYSIKEFHFTTEFIWKTYCKLYFVKRKKMSMNAIRMIQLLKLTIRFGKICSGQLFNDNTKKWRIRAKKI